MSNKYIYHSKISEQKFRFILRLFCLDIEAKKTAELVGLSRPTINKIYDAIRKVIAEDCERVSPFETGEIELDESYFGARRVRGVRGRGAQGKTSVFGMLKRNDRVYTQIVKNCSMKELMPIIEQLASKDSSIFTDGLSPTTDWLIMDINNIFVSNIVIINLPTGEIISTVLRTFGDWQKSV